jgi:fatty acid-binding protein DegV
VGWFKYAVGSTLDLKPLIRGNRNQTGPVATLRHFEEGAQKCFQFMVRRIREGLLTPALCLAYSGELAKLEQLAGYEAMREAAAQAAVEVYVTTMSITGAINVGEGALAFGFCAAAHEFE